MLSCLRNDLRTVGDANPGIGRTRTRVAPRLMGNVSPVAMDGAVRHDYESKRDGSGA